MGGGGHPPPPPTRSKLKLALDGDAPKFNLALLDGNAPKFNLALVSFFLAISTFFSEIDESP